jgi:hypothetical protein
MRITVIGSGPGSGRAGELEVVAASAGDIRP